MRKQCLLFCFCFYLLSCEKDTTLTNPVSTKIKQLIITTSTSGISTVDTFLYEYDSLNRILSEKSFPSKSSTDYTYIGQSICIQKLYSNGVEGGNIVYLFNALNKIDSIMIVSSNKQDTASSKWIYQNANVLQKVNYYDAKKMLWKRENYTFDANKNLVQIEENIINGNIVNTRNFEVNSVTPYWYSTFPLGMPTLFINTPTKQITNGSLISNITYEFDQLNRISKETWETSANNSTTSKRYTYY
ncbi:MAG: hypothetical protein ACOVNR_00210 [Chitinophagaceae bacterium]